MFTKNEENPGSYRLTKNKEWIATKDEDFSDVFFEDEDYIINATCKGEFGGTVFFKHKKTNKIYSCIATCLIKVNKQNGEYILTSALNHMISSSTIFKVKDPTKLVALGTFEAVNNWWIHAEIDRDELMKGKELMYNLDNLLIVDSFISNNRFYIISENPSTSSSIGTRYPNIVLSELKGGKLTAIDTLKKYTSFMSLSSSQKTDSITFFHYNTKYKNKKILISLKNDTIQVVTLKTGK